MKYLFLLFLSASLFAGKADETFAKASSENKYTFVFVTKQDTAHTQRMREIFQETMSKTNLALGVEIALSDETEKPFLAKHNLLKAPMPFVLSLAPNGAVMGGFPSSFSEERLTSSFATPAQEQSLKALQEHKLLFLCVQNAKTAHNESALAGVNALKSDPNYGSAMEIVMLNPEQEREFLDKLNVKIDPKEATTLFLAPPAEVIGTYYGATTKEQFTKTLKQAVSGCCPGGCCPGGCCK